MIDPAGKGQLLYQAPTKLAKNFLCLALGSNGMLYAGCYCRLTFNA
jgi:hypothetical protein